MKLEKREITLNEADSLKDMYYLEKILMQTYEKGRGNIIRKEVCNELEDLIKWAEEDKKQTFSLWQKSKSEQI
jgi:hypothetical protein